MAGHHTILPFDADDPWPDDARELMIVGPPGTGKTRTLLETYLVDAVDWSPSRAMAVSFTTAAAREIRSRLARRLGGDAQDYRGNAATMHAACHGIIGARKLKVGRPPVREVAPESEDETESLTDDADREARRFVTMYEHGLVSTLDAWDAVRARDPSTRGQPIADRMRVASEKGFCSTGDAMAHSFVASYERAKYDAGLIRQWVDFSDMLELALAFPPPDLELLLVDEVQDLYPLQWAVLNHWMTAARRTVLCGDFDQAIYQWSGADGDAMLRWIRSGRPTRRLSRSWRVPRMAHAWARRVIQTIEDREDAPYEPTEVEGSIDAVDATGATEAVRRAVDAGGSALCVSRTAAGCEDLSRVMIRSGVPHLAERGSGVRPLAAKPLRVMQALAAIEAGDDLDRRDAVELLSAFRWHRNPWRKVVAEKKDAAMKALRAADRRIPAASMTAFGIDVDAVRGQLWGAPRFESILTTAVKIDAVRLLHEWWAEHGAAVIERASRAVVTTMHGSKGREADLVVIDGRRRGRFEDRDEETRLLYVALTRTRRDLLVVAGPWLERFGRVGELTEARAAATVAHA